MFIGFRNYILKLLFSSPPNKYVSGEPNGNYCFIWMLLWLSAELISTCHLTGRKTHWMCFTVRIVLPVHSHSCKECLNFITEGNGSKNKKSQLARICKRHRYSSDIRMNGYPLSRIKILPYETEVCYYETSILTNWMYV